MRTLWKAGKETSTELRVAVSVVRVSLLSSAKKEAKTHLLSLEKKVSKETFTVGVYKAKRSPLLKEQCEPYGKQAKKLPLSFA